MRPRLSYTIWFTQRTGSTLLCKALEGAKMAGIQNEWRYTWLGEQRVSNPVELQIP